MFKTLEKRLFPGLANRLVCKMQVLTGKKLQDNPMFTFIAVTVAAVNYPKGAILEGEEVKYLPPRISQTAIWRVTEDFLDKDIGSLNDLFQAIWGLSVQEYLAKLGEVAQSGNN